VMICHTMSAQVGAIELVVQAVKSGEVSQASIEASLDRIRELKKTFLSTSTHPIRTSTLAEIEANNARHSLLSADLYAKSTTVVRSVPGSIPFSRYSETKIFYLLPGKSPSAGGAVESGEEKTREPYLGNKFMQALKSSIPGPLSANQYFELQPFSPETEDLITEADVVVFCSRNAHLSQYQKNLGLALGKRLGNKLIIIATCDPYDFLEDTEIIKNYITMYEPTVEAFVSALKILQSEISPVGVLPIGSKGTILGIRALDSSSKDDISLIWKQWQEIFPTWPIERERLAWILTQGDSSHFIHQSGFCLAYSTRDKDGLHGMISVIGVLEGSRGRGVGTHLLKSAKRELEIRCQSGNAITIGISSSFPRFWPGVPLSLPQDTKDWFSHRGRCIRYSFISQ
jgi:beta-N-acetylhexosaminidase